MRSAGRRCISASPASILHPVQVVGVIGDDYPLLELERPPPAASTGPGVERAKGESFRWKGKYSYDLQSRETLETRLGVFADFSPSCPTRSATSRYLFLGNIDPELQLGVLRAGTAAGYRGVRHDELLDPERSAPSCSSCCKRVDVLMINDSEARELSRRLEHPSRRPLGPATWPQERRH